MTQLTCRAEIKLAALPAYLPQITDRLQSFNGSTSEVDGGLNFAFPFGSARFDMPEGQLVVSAAAPTGDGLARLRDLLATAIQI